MMTWEVWNSHHDSGHHNIDRYCAIFRLGHNGDHPNLSSCVHANWCTCMLMLKDRCAHSCDAHQSRYLHGSVAVPVCQSTYKHYFSLPSVVLSCPGILRLLTLRSLLRPRAGEQGEAKWCSGEASNGRLSVFRMNQLDPRDGSQCPQVVTLFKTLPDDLEDLDLDIPGSGLPADVKQLDLPALPPKLRSIRLSFTRCFSLNDAFLSALGHVLPESVELSVTSQISVAMPRRSWPSLNMNWIWRA